MLMYPMEEFVKNHIIEIENGAHFTPRMTRSRPLWFYYPTDRFPFFTIEVEEDIFPEYAPKNVTTEAIGKRIDNNQIIKGDLIKRPMIYFAVANGFTFQWCCPLFYWCTEIFDGKHHHLVFRDEIEIIRSFKI